MTKLKKLHKPKALKVYRRIAFWPFQYTRSGNLALFTVFNRCIWQRIGTKHRFAFHKVN